ncbi:MFS transporter, partial [Rhizobium johnstonii]|uniref:MFS transporter n=1 Tax=Rhizobium johnstonii TaxID=3019933 RepID=UPI003F9E0D1F
IVPVIPEALGTSPAVIQLTLSLYMLVLGVGHIVFGPISDIVGRRPVLLGGAALFASSSFLLVGSSSAPRSSIEMPLARLPAMPQRM